MKKDEVIFEELKYTKLSKEMGFPMFVEILA